MSNIKVVADRDDIVAIADAVRAKTNSSDEMTLSGIVDGINGINDGIDTSDATATSSDILSGKSAYVDGEKIYGSINTVNQAVPSISIYSDGTVEAIATQDGGYVFSGTTSSTEQLPTQYGTTITPSTYTQTAVEAGKYTVGSVKVSGSSSLVSSNIKNGVTIFGVTGSYTGSGSTVNTCTVDIYCSDGSVLIGATTYSNGSFSYSSQYTQSTSISNVVCGSIISISCNFNGIGFNALSGASQRRTSGFECNTVLLVVTASANGFADISIYNNG